MGKRIKDDMKITSTSDVTIGDIVDAVIDRINRTDAGEGLENAVRKTVVPCTVLGKSPIGECGDGASHEDAPAFVYGKLYNNKKGDRISVGANISPALAVKSKWYNCVLQNGEVWTPYTNRRFLPFQYLRMMQSSGWNVDAAIARWYTLKECWRILETELKDLVFMRDNWTTAYAERRKFFPIEVVRDIFSEYLNALQDNLNDRSKCKFLKKSGEFVRRIQGYGRKVLWRKDRKTSTGEFGSESDITTISPSEWLVDMDAKISRSIGSIPRIATYDDAVKFMADMPRISMGTFTDSDKCVRNWLPKAWKSAFKKAGAYYTLKSLVTNCHVRYTTETGDWPKKKTSSCACAKDGLDAMLSLLDESVPGFVVHAILKKSITESGFNIDSFLRRYR